MDTDKASGTAGGADRYKEVEISGFGAAVQALDNRKEILEDIMGVGKGSNLIDAARRHSAEEALLAAKEYLSTRKHEICARKTGPGSGGAANGHVLMPDEERDRIRKDDIVIYDGSICVVTNESAAHVDLVSADGTVYENVGISIPDKTGSRTTALSDALKAVREAMLSKETEIETNARVCGFAAKLEGMDFSAGENQLLWSEAKKQGLVVVFGYGDYLTELRGEIDDEIECFDGRTFSFSKNGELGAEGQHRNRITSLWYGRVNGRAAEDAYDLKTADKKTVPWTYRTDIPHSVFKLYECGLPFCYGIVFALKNCK